MELKNLKYLRKINKLTQLETSNELKIPLRTYNAYENGEYEPNIETLIKIANYFNVSVDYIINRQQNNKIDISGLSEAQQNIIKMATELDETNAIRVESYISAKIEAQNESHNIKKYNQ